SAEWAERFQSGSVFLAGDSAHVMPPTGGFGGNTGVQDGHNLAWKLAYVSRGEAGAALLDTYDTERRPAGEFAAEQAYTRYVVRLDPELDSKENLQPYVPEHVVELGYRYHSPAIIGEPGDDGSTFEDPATPTARPGSRLPHLELESGSTLDLVGRSFVVLTVDESWHRAAAASSVVSHLVTSPGFREAY